MMRSILLFILLSLVSPLGLASQPLPANEAFALQASLRDNQTLELHWQMPEGYYLYQQRFNITLLTPKTVSIGRINYPQGIKKHDDLLGDYVVYFKQLSLIVPLLNPESQPVSLSVSYQGCSESGFCYPKETQQIKLSRDAAGKTQITRIQHAALTLSEQGRIEKMLRSQNLWVILSAFFMFGILLTFTPCVLPMIPIISAIIVGERDISPARAFLDSFVYVMAMAITYALAGVAAGLLGSNVQSALQNPWVLAFSSAVFAGLALSLFGFYEIRLPRFIEEHLHHHSRKHQGGSLIGIAIMGVLSSLIISPCVSAPLIGALAYIGNTGNATLGGLALFFLGLGMGLPLLLIGTTSGTLLPKSGPWMIQIKRLFGFLLLAVSLWLLARLLPETLMLGLWGCLSILAACGLGLMQPAKRFAEKLWKGFSLLLLIYGIALLLGAFAGNSDPLHPLSGLLREQHQKSTPLFTRHTSKSAITTALATAKKLHRPAILDFYADWCISCKEMEHSTFADSRVHQALTGYTRLQADVTAQTPEQKALQRQYAVIAPPTILFFDSNGTQINQARMVGTLDTKAFLTRIKELAR